ncbi:hypothetical protein BDV96DRAFT_649388 [Lophiotrema nucula]|uniref:Uncharacterized protein n=1 Tax=Lophiotrema nucula TaxID=690887 RepID=A0A6A5YYX9_9PLEO|nr:hypothetical protein BDV96DRAFT_649388 [Lophiotrema nucula]
MSRSKRLKPLKLVQNLHPETSNRMADQDRREGIVSVDLNRSQQHCLGLPSPYHDNFSEPSPRTVPPRDIQVPLSRPSKRPNFTTNIFRRFSYSKVSQDPSSAEHAEAASPTAEDPEKPVEHHVHWADTSISEESPADRWFAVIFLLLLLSVLFNFFLLFNGPTNGIPRHPKNKNDPLPHHGFKFKDHGKNYTCCEMKSMVFESDFQYSNTLRTYDRLWVDMQGKTHGMVYTSLNRGDGKVRRAGFAMFHQLDCLSKLRSVIQALQNGDKQHEDGGELHGYWPHCFDYLRQTILCNADDSVEVSEVRDGNWVDKGFDSVKECRDQTWLYEVTACGERGCEGKSFYHTEEEMKKIHKEEEGDVERWRKEQKHNS